MRSNAQLFVPAFSGSLHWAPNHPLRMKCIPDTHGSWDYLCTDAYLHEVWGYDVPGKSPMRTW